MEHNPWILLLLTILLIGASLLYQWSTTFNFYCKTAFFFGWIIILATMLTPIVAVINGRNIENMKILCFCVKPLKYFFGIKITVQGSENLKIQEPYVIVSNHQSCFDLLGLVEVIPDRCVTVAKKELLYLGPIGWAVWVCGLIFIDRKKKLEAIATMEHIAQTMRQDDVKVLVYPEGTRNDENTMLPFKRGAFHLAIMAQVPIFPIVTSSLKSTYNYKEKRFNPGHWTIRILPKIETKGLRVEDAMALAQSTRNLMQDTFYEISRDVCEEKDPRQ